MKIAVWHNLPSGGGKRALYDQVKGLSKRGHHIESWCPPTADQKFLSIGSLVKEHIVPLTWPADMRGRLKAMDEHCRKCAEEMNTGGFDVLFANACTYFRTSPIAKYVRMPAVLYLPEPYRWLYEALPQLPWPALPEMRAASLHSLKTKWKDFCRVRALRLQAREELSNAAAFGRILVNSLYSRESVLKAYGLESTVCYLGVDTDTFKPLEMQRKNFVAGLGFVYYGKGLDRAIRAVAAIPKEKRMDLIWIGNGADKEYQLAMEKLADGLGVRLVFKIGIPHEEVLTCLSEAKALLYTSRLEPFGLAVLEAGACGTPVAAVAEGGVRESVRENVNGFLVPGDEPDSLARALRKIFEEETFERLSISARRYVVENWNMEKAIGRLEELLKEAL